MAAIRHDVRVRMFLASQWEDITDYVLTRSTIRITRGRKDENTMTPPSTASMSLLNNDGRFSIHNPMGPWYGTLGQNNPVEVTKRLVSWAPSSVLTDTWGSTDAFDGVPRYSWSVFSGGASNFDVGLTGATVVSPVANSVMRNDLSGFTRADASAFLEYSINIANVTGDYLMAPSPVLRGTYYARIEIQTDETIRLAIYSTAGVALSSTITPSFSHASGTRYGVRLLADGRTLAAKLWRIDDGEPLAWDVTGTAAKASGSVGVRAGTGPTNTNVPVMMTVHALTVDAVRFMGEVSSFPATSQANGRDQFVPIEAAGIMRRLGQGRSPTLSALRRGILSVTPVAYWPCEEGPDATGISAATEGVQPMEINPAPSLPDFAAFDGFACSAPIPLVNNTGWIGTIPDYDASAQEAQIRALISVPASGASGVDERLFRINMAGGTSAKWDLITQSDGSLKVNAYDPDGAAILTGTPISFDVNGKQLRIGLWVRQSGANVEWQMSTVEPNAGGGLYFSDTLVGRTVGQVTSIEVGGNGTYSDLACGHVTFQNEATDIFEVVTQLNAHTGERAGTRMSRLATENGVPFVYYGDATTSAQVGAQRVDSFIDLIRGGSNAAADADLGTVHERRSFNALAYRDRRSTYAQTSVLTLSLAAKTIVAPFQPVYDDQNTRNDITLRRTDGSELRRVIVTGRKSALDPPDGVGVYDDSPELNLYQDVQLPDTLGFLLALGTVDDSRYLSLRLNLDSPEVVRAGLSGAILDIDIDDRVTITNASSVFVFDDIHQLVRGYTEVLGNHQHTFEFMLSPSAPYDTGTIDGGTYRVGSDTSSLTNALSETATGAVSVTTTDVSDLFTTNASMFPMDIMIGGERVTLSGVSGATSPQTFTISARSVNGVRKSHTAGTPVNVFDRWRIGL